MGTRAVVHADLRPLGYDKDIWIATHWDGYPDGLGKNLAKAIKSEIETFKNRFPKIKKKDYEWGSIIQKAVIKTSAEHSIDEFTNEGKEDFDKKYGDWAEYEYEVYFDKKRLKPIIKFRERSGLWKEAKVGEWKLLRAREKLKKVM